MAITQPPYYNDESLYSVNQIATYDYAIGGKLLVATARLSLDRVLGMEDEEKDHIKQTLVKLLVEQMIKEGFVEFTQADESDTMFRVIRARAYVAPDSQVKILRSLKKV